MIIKDGNPEIYMQLQGMNYSGLYGHLKEIVLMENISETEDGIKYTTEEPSYIIYSTFPANICKQCLYKLGL